MLLRSDERGTLAIGQPAHAWICGQLARAWGGEAFGAVEPWEEVCLAAEQHDIGMAQWDLAPTRNPDTGLPHDFTEMPIETHVALWSAGPRRLLTQSRYASLLASMHGAHLYENRDLATFAPLDADAVGRFLEDQRSYQQRLIASLAGDPCTAPSVEPGTLTRNGALIRTWDFLSLALCLDWAPTTARGVPDAGRSTELRIEPLGGPLELRVHPWPFAAPGSLTIRCEGRRLAGRYASDVELATALARAPWETLAFTLRS